MSHRVRVLVSVTDKRGLDKWKALDPAKYEFISTGGTAKHLKELGIECTPIERVTNFPEMMDGRLKTLHPNIFGGILADRRKLAHLDAIAEHGIEEIDVVVVNLYDFKSGPGIEEIDIGGPSLLRAAAKNCDSVVVVCDPDDYSRVIAELSQNGRVPDVLRMHLAMKVFQQTGTYDLRITDWMNTQIQSGRSFVGSEAVSASH